MKKLPLLIFSLLLAGLVSAQSQFMLYSMKGNVTIVNNKVESKAKIGAMISPTSSVKISNGGSATFICNEAAMFSLVKPGTYSLNNFNDSCQSSHGSVSANYVKYVWASMTKNAGNPGSNRKAYMNTVGAVSRGINNVWIDPRLDTLNYISGEFPLSWKSYADANTFDFNLYSADNLNEPMYKTVVSKQKIPVTDFIAKLAPGKTYYWTAAVTGETNEELKVLSYVTKSDFEKTLVKVKAMGATYEAPAEQAYRIAFLLEDAHYLSEAYQYYVKAAQLDPNNVLYRSTLMSFKKDYEIK
jgi:hypothetical protein